jgi:hypothetical protein
VTAKSANFNLVYRTQVSFMAITYAGFVKVKASQASFAGATISVRDF